LLIFGRFSRRYDTDIFVAFRVRYNDHLTFQDANRDETGFAILETLIWEEDNIAIEDFWDINKVNAMFSDIGSTFSLIPFITHVLIVPTKCSYVNRLAVKIVSRI
jgi:hypothetical protein